MSEKLKQVSTNLSDRECQVIARVAAREGRSFSNMVRQLLWEALKERGH